MKEFWNERYSKSEFVYGKEPNLFFKEELRKMTIGKVLLPAEGEGRNAVYASANGWDVYAFDTSEEGKKKAMSLASEMKVEIVYDLMDIADFNSEDRFDCIALIFAHFPKQMQQVFFEKIKTLLKVGGKLVVEGYSVEQMKNGTGGPQNDKVMYVLKDLESAFVDFDIEIAENKTLNLSEGIFHQGKSDVIRFVAKKK